MAPGSPCAGQGCHPLLSRQDGCCAALGCAAAKDTPCAGQHHAGTGVSVKACHGQGWGLPAARGAGPETEWKA